MQPVPEVVAYMDTAPTGISNQIKRKPMKAHPSLFPAI
jgi:hypothetical protein